MSSTAKATWRMPGALLALVRRGVELRQLESSMAGGGLQHRDLRANALEPNDTVGPAALDRSLALQLESEFDEELDRGREVVHDDADVLHSLDRHVPDGKESRQGVPDLARPKRRRPTQHVPKDATFRDPCERGIAQYRSSQPS